MLRSAGDAAGNVQIRSDDLAGLSDLVSTADPAVLDNGTGRADHAAEHVSQLFAELVVLLGTHAAAAGDNDLCVFKVDSFACLGKQLQDSCDQSLIRFRCQLGDLRNTLRSLVAAAADADDSSRGINAQFLADGAAVDRAGNLQLSVLARHRDRIVHGACAKTCGNTCRGQLAQRSRCKKDHIVALSCLLRDSADDSIFLQNTLFFRDLDKICFSAQRFSRGDQFQTSADRSAFFCLNKD